MLRQALTSWCTRQHCVWLVLSALMRGNSRGFAMPSFLPAGSLWAVPNVSPSQTICAKPSPRSRISLPHEEESARGQNP